MKSQKTKKENKKNWIVVGCVLVSCLVLISFFFDICCINGESMVPTFADGEYVLIEEISIYFNEISRGDIVVVKYPNGRLCVKRVVAMEGDSIEIKNGVLLLNGQVIQETYINESMYAPMEIKTINKDMVFIMGDNRNYSTDSRNPDIGEIPYNNIKGKVCFSIF